MRRRDRSVSLLIRLPALHLGAAWLKGVFCHLSKKCHDFPQFPHEAQRKYFYHTATTSPFAIPLGGGGGGKRFRKTLSRLRWFRYCGLYSEVIRNFGQIILSSSKHVHNLNYRYIELVRCNFTVCHLRHIWFVLGPCKQETCCTKFIGTM